MTIGPTGKLGNSLRRFGVILAGGASAAALVMTSTAQATTDGGYGVRPDHARGTVSQPQTAGTTTGYSAPSSTTKAAGWWAANAWWWWNPAGGWTLSITPTGLAQAWGTQATSRVWNDALAIAGTRRLSSYAYSSLYEQLKCHLWYTFKTPYNLDSWRPVVSWWYQLHTGCNP